MEIGEIEYQYQDMIIVVSEGGASIIGDGWDLSLPSKKFDAIVKKHGVNHTILKEEVIAYYKNFFKKIKTMKGQFTFIRWSEVKDKVKAARREAERGLKGVHKFHYHGLVVMINDERAIGDLIENISLSCLKSLIQEAESNYPDAVVEVSLEGHYDWWESYQSLFRGDEYEPTDIYIDIPLYTNKPLNS